MISRTITAFGTAVACTGALALAGMAAMQDRDAQPDDTKPRVGIVEINQVFEQYPGTQEFQQRVQALEQEFIQAQQEGNQERMMALQTQFTEMQQQLNEAFRRDMEIASGDVAKKENVKIVVSDVIYQADDVEEVDLTPALIETLTDQAPQNDADGNNDN